MATVEHLGKAAVGHGAHEHTDPLKSYLIVFFLLLLLLGATVGVYYWDLGPLNTPIALAIATVKAMMVVLVFMHLRHGTRLTWIVAGAGAFGLALFLIFTFADYMTRASIKENFTEANAYPTGIVIQKPMGADPTMDDNW